MELKKIKLKKLFLDLDVKIIGNKDLEISGLSSHSKMVAPGHLFIAKGGHVSHGAKFVEEAIIGGARAVLTDLYDPFSKSITQIICKDPKTLEGILAERYYGNPVKDLSMIGITGTNGKTTTAYILRGLLGEQGCGLIGTIEYLLGNTSLPASLTTPDVLTNYKMLSKMRDNKLKSCVMEVTSHALSQNRVTGIEFDYAVFTNLTQDHLDYHKTLENYINAKAKLFKDLREDKVALFNCDSPHFDAMSKGCRARILTYGIHKEANYRATNISLNVTGTSFDLIYEGQSYPIKTKLVGEFNIYNALAAIAVAHQKGISFESIQKKLETLKAPQGRLEPIPNDRGIQLYVDFAHTDDALKNILITLKQIKHKRLITVFGCGGDRDSEKRPIMGRVVSELSDLTVITSDNPRSEDPQNICEQIKLGCSSKAEVHVRVERLKGIQLGIDLAEPGDIVLVAGRGHESHQIIGHKRVEFNDRRVIEELLEKSVCST